MAPSRARNLLSERSDGAYVVFTYGQKGGRLFSLGNWLVSSLGSKELTGATIQEEGLQCGE